MTNFHALILGILQGITEFLPISSTGHLVLLPKVFGWSETPLFFDTSLHLGTALAIIVYFWKEFYEIIVSLFKDLVLKIKSAKSYKVFLNDYSENSLLGMKIIVGSIPAGIIGFLLEDYFDTVFRQISWVAVFVILGSLLMLLAEKYKFFKFISSKVKKVENLKELSLKQSFFIGLFQALALFPGFSRSGSTISGGMLLGLKREDSSKFSFLLSVPIVLVAGFYKLIKSYGILYKIYAGPLLIGFFASFALGLLAIEFLLGFVKKNNLMPFIAYRLVLALVIFLLII